MTITTDPNADPDPFADLLTTPTGAAACHACGVELRSVILGRGHHHDPAAEDVVDELDTSSEHGLALVLSMATTGERILMHRYLTAVRGADAVDPLWEAATEIADGALIPADLTELLTTLLNRPSRDWPRLRVRFVHQYSALALAGRDPRDLFEDAVDLARHEVQVNHVRAQLGANLDELVRLAGTCDTLLERLDNELYDEAYSVGLPGADLGAALADAARHARAAVRIHREIVFPPST